MAYHEKGEWNQFSSSQEANPVAWILCDLLLFEACRRACFMASSHKEDWLKWSVWLEDWGTWRETMWCWRSIALLRCSLASVRWLRNRPNQSAPAVRLTTPTFIGALTPIAVVCGVCLWAWAGHSADAMSGMKAQCGSGCVVFGLAWLTSPRGWEWDVRDAIELSEEAALCEGGRQMSWFWMALSSWTAAHLVVKSALLPWRSPVHMQIGPV